MFDFYATYIVPASILLPISLGLYSFTILSKPFKILLYFLGCSAVLNSIALFFAAHHHSNLFMFHLYAIVEFALISWLYAQLLEGLIKKLIPMLICSFTIVCIINVLFFQKMTLFNTYTRPLSMLIIIGYTTYFFYTQITSPRATVIDADGLSWINTGFLLYYTTCFITFIFLNYSLSATKTVNVIIWNFLDTMLLIEYTLFGVGLYTCRKQRTTSLS